MDNNDNLISIFIGYDSRERAATNVLIDSIYQNSTVPVSITPLVKAQLESKNLFYRKRDKNQKQNYKRRLQRINGDRKKLKLHN